jgi:hypothetical protein
MDMHAKVTATGEEGDKDKKSIKFAKLKLFNEDVSSPAKSIDTPPLMAKYDISREWVLAWFSSVQ